MNTNKLIEHIWFEVDVPNDCEGCNNLEEISDQFNTGDSPSDWQCKLTTGNECPKVKEALIDALEVIGVDEHECIFHKKQAM